MGLECLSREKRGGWCCLLRIRHAKRGEPQVSCSSSGTQTQVSGPPTSFVVWHTLKIESVSHCKVNCSFCCKRQPVSSCLVLSDLMVKCRLEIVVLDRSSTGARSTGARSWEALKTPFPPEAARQIDVSFFEICAVRVRNDSRDVKISARVIVSCAEIEVSSQLNLPT